MHNFDEDAELYDFGVKDKEAGFVECNFEMNEQFEKPDIEQFASELNESLTDKFNSEDEDIEIAIEGQTSYLEIKILNKSNNTSAYLQVTYFKLCYYGNRSNIDLLAEKIADLVLESCEESTDEDLQALLEQNI